MKKFRALTLVLAFVTAGCASAPPLPPPVYHPIYPPYISSWPPPVAPQPAQRAEPQGPVAFPTPKTYVATSDENSCVSDFTAISDRAKMVLETAPATQRHPQLLHIRQQLYDLQLRCPFPQIRESAWIDVFRYAFLTADFSEADTAYEKLTTEYPQSTFLSYADAGLKAYRACRMSSPMSLLKFAHAEYRAELGNGYSAWSQLLMDKEATCPQIRNLAETMVEKARQQANPGVTMGL